MPGSACGSASSTSALKNLRTISTFACDIAAEYPRGGGLRFGDRSSRPVNEPVEQPGAQVRVGRQPVERVSPHGAGPRTWCRAAPGRSARAAALHRPGVNGFWWANGLILLGSWPGLAAARLAGPKQQQICDTFRSSRGGRWGSSAAAARTMNRSPWASARLNLAYGPPCGVTRTHVRTTVKRQEDLKRASPGVTFPGGRRAAIAKELFETLRGCDRCPSSTARSARRPCTSEPRQCSVLAPAPAAAQALASRRGNSRLQSCACVARRSSPLAVESSDKRLQTG